MALRKPGNWNDAKSRLQRMFPNDSLRGSILGRLIPMGEPQRLEFFDETEECVKANLLALAGTHRPSFSDVGSQKRLARCTLYFMLKQEPVYYFFLLDLQ